jgi:hypothetical protein
VARTVKIATAMAVAIGGWTVVRSVVATIGVGWTDVGTVAGVGRTVVSVPSAGAKVGELAAIQNGASKQVR